MRSWCASQALQLGADMALLEFCYASSPSEVYDTLTAYLGEKPQVKAFAEEFIKRAGAAVASKAEPSTEWVETKSPPSKVKGKKR